VLHAIKAAGAKALSVPVGKLKETESVQSRGWAALVYDLNPWDQQGATLVRTLRQTYPGRPILLYVPHRPGIVALVQQIGKLAGVVAESQFHDAEESTRLREAVSRLVISIPAERVASMIRVLLGTAHERRIRFVRAAASYASRGHAPSRATVTAVAATIHVSQRTINRSFQLDGLPPPHETLQWVTRRYIAFSAQWSGQPCAAVARSINIGPNALYRLRHGLLPDVESFAEFTPSQEFQDTLIAFARRCGTPDSHMSRVLNEMSA
jgi:hypothetical protein